MSTIFSCISAWQFAHTSIHFPASFMISSIFFSKLFPLTSNSFSIGSMWWNISAFWVLLYPHMQHLFPALLHKNCFLLCLTFFFHSAKLFFGFNLSLFLTFGFFSFVLFSVFMSSLSSMVFAHFDTVALLHFSCSAICFMDSFCFLSSIIFLPISFSTGRLYLDTVDREHPKISAISLFIGFLLIILLFALTLF
jgi:hypothetical protein